MGEVVNGVQLPDKNWQRDPFKEGNEAALVHGAYSRRWLDERALQIRGEILAAPGNEYLRESKYQGAVDDVVQLERRREKLLEFIEGAGGLIAAMEETETSDSEEVRTSGGGSRRMTTTRRRQAALTALEKTETALRRCRSDLGLTPLSRARLGRDVAAAKADVVQLLTQLRESAEQAATAEVSQDDQR